MNGNTNKAPSCVVTIGETQVKMTIDSGASVNIIDEHTYNNLTEPPPLLPPTSVIYAYGSTCPLPVSGSINVNISHKDVTIQSRIQIVRGEGGNLLGYKTAIDLGLITIAQSISNKNVEETQQFSGLFNGIGKMKDKVVKLHIDNTVRPKQQPHRRIPFHVRKDVDNELERLLSLDIIEKAVGPTPWVNPIVVVPKKSGQIRICVDMREANKAITREKHLVPTIDELITDLNGATVFSTLDLASGYHQLELNPSCRYITTFSTHQSLYRYKRLMFGINAASEIFQHAVAEMLHGLKGVKNISDDIIVYGTSTEDHDENLRAALTRIQEFNVTLNKEKCRFSQPSVTFYGHVFGKWNQCRCRQNLSCD